MTNRLLWIIAKLLVILLRNLNGVGVVVGERSLRSIETELEMMKEDV
jgi:hypothetical protein